MNKVNIRASVHGKSCIGRKREGKPIMLSLDGTDAEGQYKYLDAFLTTAEANLLIAELNNIILENEKENK